VRPCPAVLRPGEGSVVLGKLWRPRGTAMVHRTRPIALEEGCSGSWRRAGRRRASASVAGRGATFKGERVWCWGVGRLPRGAHAALAGAPGRGADDGPRGRARRRYDEVNAARVPRRSARRGAGGSRLETVVRSCTEAEETRWPARSAQRSPAGRTRRRAGGALERDRSGFQPVNASLTAFFSKKLNRSAQSGQQENCRSNYPLQLS
jgi:hypothetical protein